MLFSKKPNKGLLFAVIYVSIDTEIYFHKSVPPQGLQTTIFYIELRR